MPDDALARPPAASLAGKLIVYFAPDFTEVSTIAHAQAFQDNGFAVAVAAFRRGRYNRAYQAPWREVDLGRTEDGKYLRRLLAMGGALAALWRQRRLLRSASAFYARNIDQLVLAFLSRLLFGRRQTDIVYEVLDVAAALTRADALGTLLRGIERALLSRIQLLVVSSPAFITHYFESVQAYRGPRFLLENKLHPAIAPAVGRRRPDRAPPSLPRRTYKWTVGYFGLIRGQATFDLITRLAERFPDDVLFHFAGVVTTVDRQRFAQVIAAHDNMHYSGSYVNPDDLAELYGGIDLAWALDLEHEHHNSSWLMPCRFYEAGALGVPCLAAKGFEVGRRVAELGIGWTVERPYADSLIRLFEELTRADYDAVRARLAALPRSTFVSSDDAARLCRALDNGTEVKPLEAVAAAQ